MPNLDFREKVSTSGGYKSTSQQTLNVTTGGSYSNNAYVGTSGSPMIFPGAGRGQGGAGDIQTAVLMDMQGRQASMELWLFSTQVTPPADKAPFLIGNSDLTYCVGVLPFQTYFACQTSGSTNAAVCLAEPTQIVSFKCASGDSNLYGCMVNRSAAAPVFASGSMSVLLTLRQD